MTMSFTMQEKTLKGKFGQNLDWLFGKNLNGFQLKHKYVFNHLQTK